MGRQRSWPDAHLRPCDHPDAIAIIDIGSRPWQLNIPLKSAEAGEALLDRGCKIVPVAPKELSQRALLVPVILADPVPEILAGFRK